MKSFLNDNEFIRQRLDELGVEYIFGICNKDNREKEEVKQVTENICLVEQNVKSTFLGIPIKGKWEDLYKAVMRDHFSIWETQKHALIRT